MVILYVKVENEREKKYRLLFKVRKSKSVIMDFISLEIKTLMCEMFHVNSVIEKLLLTFRKCRSWIRVWKCEWKNILYVHIWHLLWAVPKISVLFSNFYYIIRYCKENRYQIQLRLNIKKLSSRSDGVRTRFFFDLKIKKSLLYIQLRKLQFLRVLEYYL